MHYFVAPSIIIRITQTPHSGCHNVPQNQHTHKPNGIPEKNTTYDGCTDQKNPFQPSSLLQPGNQRLYILDGMPHERPQGGPDTLHCAPNFLPNRFFSIFKSSTSFLLSSISTDNLSQPLSPWLWCPLFPVAVRKQDLQNPVQQPLGCLRIHLLSLHNLPEQPAELLLAHLCPLLSPT